jgi:integral membrane protein (TIGR01906 family)
VRRVEGWVAGVVLAVLTLGAALLPLQLPWFSATLSARYSELPRAVALPLAEAARDFVVSGDPASRQELVQAMTPQAVTHLEDVEIVLGAANTATLVLSLGLGAWAWFRARRRADLRRSALGTAAVLLSGSVVLAMGVALIDFDTFFSAFHGLFFEPGTWTFPSDSVLIRVFPEPFWTAAGTAWALLVLLAAGAYGYAWRAGREVPIKVASVGSQHDVRTEKS